MADHIERRRVNVWERIDPDNHGKPTYCATQLYADEDGVDLVAAQLTSLSKTATVAKRQQMISLSPADLRWLLEILPEAIAECDEQDGDQ